jgi:hypothetical protein
VVVFVQTRDLERPTGQTLAVWINGSLQEVAVLGADETNRQGKSSIHHESVPPFWTWFIENPRPHTSRSFRNLAGLTFAA